MNTSYKELPMRQNLLNPVKQMKFWKFNNGKNSKSKKFKKREIRFKEKDKS